MAVQVNAHMVERKVDRDRGCPDRRGSTAIALHGVLSSIPDDINLGSTRPKSAVIVRSGIRASRRIQHLIGTAANSLRSREN